MTTVTPADDFQINDYTITVSDSQDENIDAWEGIEYVSVPLGSLGSQIDYDFELDGNQPPGLDIDPSTGVIEGTVDEGIFSSFIRSVAEKKEQGNVTVDLGSDEYPSPYEVGSGEMIKKDFDFQVTGMDSSPDPHVEVTESYTIRVGKNFSVDIDDFNPREVYE